VILIALYTVNICSYPWPLSAMSDLASTTLHIISLLTAVRLLGCTSPMLLPRHSLPEAKRTLGRHRPTWDDNINRKLEEIWWGHGMDSCGLGYGPVAGSCERGNERSNSIK